MLAMLTLYLLIQHTNMWINTLALPPLLTSLVENTTYAKGPIVY